MSVSPRHVRWWLSQFRYHLLSLLQFLQCRGQLLLCGMCVCESLYYVCAQYICTFVYVYTVCMCILYIQYMYSMCAREYNVCVCVVTYILVIFRSSSAVVRASLNSFNNLSLHSSASAQHTHTPSHITHTHTFYITHTYSLLHTLTSYTTVHIYVRTCMYMYTITLTHNHTYVHTTFLCIF